MSDTELRQQLVNMLTHRQAHMMLEDAVADFPPEHYNSRPPNTPYSFWHLLEHLRLAQKDILDYIAAEEYHWPNFPDDYWPSRAAEASPADWQATLDAFFADRAALADIIANPSSDLFAPLPHSGEHQHNIIREINIIASHNAYHTGEFGILRGSLDLWQPGRQ